MGPGWPKRFTSPNLQTWWVDPKIGRRLDHTTVYIHMKPSTKNMRVDQAFQGPPVLTMETLPVWDM